jgi:hypothetical protein
VLEVRNPKRPSTSYINPAGGFVTDPSVLDGFPSKLAALHWFTASFRNETLHLDDEVVPIELP